MDLETAPTRRIGLIDATATLFVLGLTSWLFSAPLRQHGLLLRFAQDDFFYYLGVARHLADRLGSTFDGTTRTNGYHPLYLLLLWGALKFCATLPSIFRFLWVVDVLSALGIFTGSRALLRTVFSGSLLPNALAAGLTSVCCLTMCQQMEVILTLPLAFWFLALVYRQFERGTAGAALMTGLVGALMVLSRLDSLLLVILCIGFALFSRPGLWRRLRSHQARGLLAGFLPLVLGYLLVNVAVFHRLTPVSGAAKQMKTVHGFAFNVLRGAVSRPTAAMFALCLVALLCLPSMWRRLHPGHRIVCAAALIFPFAHWGTVLWLSDWPIWGWYGYSLRIALVGVLLLAGAAFKPLGQLSLPLQWAVLAVAMGLLATSRYRLDGEMADIAYAAAQIRTFAQSHPGRYAMGDRGGMVGFFDGQPTIQLEGLVMDDTFLDHIRQQEPLRDVLRMYNVDFYVGFSRGAPGGCFEAREPANAGPDSPVMRGEFCEAPVNVIVAPSGRTLILDLRGSPPNE